MHCVLQNVWRKKSFQHQQKINYYGTASVLITALLHLLNGLFRYCNHENSNNQNNILPQKEEGVQMINSVVAAEYMSHSFPKIVKISWRPGPRVQIFCQSGASSKERNQVHRRWFLLVIQVPQATWGQAPPWSDPKPTASLLKSPTKPFTSTESTFSAQYINHS